MQDGSARSTKNGTHKGADNGDASQEDLFTRPKLEAGAACRRSSLREGPSTPPPPTPPPPPSSGAPVWERRPRELELEIFAVPLSASSTSKCPLLSRSCPSSLHRYFHPPPKHTTAFWERFARPAFPSSSFSPNKVYSRRPLPCPLLVSLLAVCLTLAVTASVLFWNYTETRHRRLTKKPSLILDHWGKKGPLLDDPDLVGAGGIVVYGETALRGEGNFHGESKIFPEVGDWQNLSGLSREQENGGEKEKVVEAEKEEEDKDVMTRW